MLVCDLSEGTHGVLSGFHVLRAESLIAHGDALDNSHSSVKERLEGLARKCISECTKAISNSMLNHIALSKLLVREHLKELLSEL